MLRQTPQSHTRIAIGIVLPSPVLRALERGRYGFQCAEFVARALATEGLVPGRTSTSSQYSLDPYRPAGSKKSYDLLLITRLAGLYTLSDYLVDRGLGKNIGRNLQAASPGDMVVFEDSAGTPRHTALLVTVGSSTATTKVDAHNYARYNYPLSGYFPHFHTFYILHFARASA